MIKFLHGRYSVQSRRNGMGETLKSGEFLEPKKSTTNGFIQLELYQDRWGTVYMEINTLAARDFAQKLLALCDGMEHEDGTK